MHSDKYTFAFAAGVCLICSIVLAIVASTLRPRQEYNFLIDRKKNVLKALSLYDVTEKLKAAEIERRYSEKIRETIVDKSGNEVAGKTLEDAAGDPGLLPVYVRSDNGSFVLPVEGFGLWSVIKGYFALNEDGHTVVGITFYEQGETPGLGAECEKPWFTNNFINKDILNSRGDLTSIAVVKGKATDYKGAEIRNIVDGISGATITSRGITNLLQKGVQTYQPYLKKRWAAAGVRGDNN